MRNEQYRVVFALGLVNARYQELSQPFDLNSKDHFKISKLILELMNKDFEPPDEDLVGR